MSAPSRNSVGIYDRPHPLRTRKVWLPVAVGLAVSLAYGLWWYFA